MEMQEEIEKQRQIEESNNKRLKVSMTEEIKAGEQMKAEIEIGKDYNYHQQMMDQYRLKRFGADN